MPNDVSDRPLCREDMQRLSQLLREAQPQPVVYPPITLDQWLRFTNALEREFGKAQEGDNGR